MTCLFHVEGLLVPTLSIPKDHIGPEIRGDMHTSTAVGVFPVNEDLVIVGKLTLLIKSDKNTFLVGDYVEVPPTNLKDHTEINNILTELGHTLYDDRCKFKWVKKLDRKETRIITHHAYEYAGNLRFVNDAEKTQFLEFHEPRGQPALIRAKKFNSYLVDVMRAVPTDSTITLLYRATNAPHPKLGDYVLVH